MISFILLKLKMKKYRKLNKKLLVVIMPMNEILPFKKKSKIYMIIIFWLLLKNYWEENDQFLQGRFFAITKKTNNKIIKRKTRLVVSPKQIDYEHTYSLTLCYQNSIGCLLIKFFKLAYLNVFLRKEIYTNIPYNNEKAIG